MALVTVDSMGFAAVILVVGVVIILCSECIEIQVSARLYRFWQPFPSDVALKMLAVRSLRKVAYLLMTSRAVSDTAGGGEIISKCTK
jgi:hypothetical protein